MIYLGESGAAVRCPGHDRHWYTARVRERLPFCVRCGAARPRELQVDDLEEAEYICSESLRLGNAFVYTIGIEVHPVAGDFYNALTGSELTWEVFGEVRGGGYWQLGVYEPSWQELDRRRGAAGTRGRGRRPRDLFLTTEQLQNEKRWELA